MPRLTRTESHALLDDLKPAKPGELRSEHASTRCPEQHWYPIGPRVDDDLLTNLREQLSALEDEFGFPDDLRLGTGNGSQSTFDRELGRLLADWTDQNSIADADHPLTWCWLATVLAPDVVVWRFGWSNYRRFDSDYRNALRRVWYRTVLYADDDGLYPPLSEDNLSAVEERPSIGAVEGLGRELLGGILAVRERLGNPSGFEAAVRDACKKITTVNATTPIHTGNARQLIDELIADNLRHD